MVTGVAEVRQWSS